MNQAMSTLRQRWASLAARERRALSTAGLLIAAAAVWLIAVQPAWRTLRQAPTELARLESQWRAMQQEAAVAQALRAAPPVPQALAVQALRGATETLGDAGSLQIQGDRAVLIVKDADADALRQWLVEARAAARARPVEVRLTRSAAGFNGTVVVSIGVRP